MLRYLYLLSLLICIELSVCYNYIEEPVERNLNKFGRNVRRDRERKLRRAKERKSLLRQEYDYDRSPVEFDVASFIQPDEESLEDDEAFRNRNKKRRRTSKNYDYGTLMGMNVDEGSKKRDKSPDYLNLGDTPPDLNINPPLFKDAMNSINSMNSLNSLNPKHLGYNPLEDLHSDKYGHEKFRNIYKDDLLMDQNIAHSHEKKCTLKHIKFPFFSHNKSETMKPKKNKKRKLFCFNCPKKEDNGLKLPDENKMSDDPITQYKIKKRSYEERLCPACKKIYVANLELNKRRKKTPKRVIHNSRQFFQTNFPEPKLKEDVKNIRKSNVVYSEEGLDSRSRKKREEDRERQLKELEEVQKKVDNVQIHVPTFQKQSDNR